MVHTAEDAINPLVSCNKSLRDVKIHIVFDRFLDGKMRLEKCRTMTSSFLRATALESLEVNATHRLQARKINYPESGREMLLNSEYRERQVEFTVFGNYLSWKRREAKTRRPLKKWLDILRKYINESRFTFTTPVQSLISAKTSETKIRRGCGEETKRSNFFCTVNTALHLSPTPQFFD